MNTRVYHISVQLKEKYVMFNAQVHKYTKGVDLSEVRSHITSHRGRLKRTKTSSVVPNCLKGVHLQLNLELLET
jgi:hypothetical protein